MVYVSSQTEVSVSNTKLKALVLAGGRGTRLRPLTNTIPKPLIPVANKPVLFYALEKIEAAGVGDIGIVVSPGTGRNIKEAVDKGFKKKVRISYIVQAEPLGIAHAVKVAGNFLGNSAFLLFLGDNLLQEGVTSLVEDFSRHCCSALIALKDVANPSAFGVAEVDALGKVLRVVEKPKLPKTNLAIVGAYLFTSEVHEAIAQIKLSWRGEYEITDAIQRLLENGREVRGHRLQGWWLDTGSKKDILEANRVVLSEVVKRKIKGTVDSDSRVIGRVAIGEGTKIVNSLIRGPVCIAENCQIIGSFVGPYTSIGAGVRVEKSSVEYSLVMDNSSIIGIGRLVDSLIGNNSNSRGQKVSF